MFCSTQGQNLSSWVTALLIIKSNFSEIFSALSIFDLTFFISKSSIIWSTTFIFLPIESTNVNEVFLKYIANGMPGKPPPVPTSNIFVCFLKSINLAMDNECNTCLV